MCENLYELQKASSELESYLQLYTKRRVTSEEFLRYSRTERKEIIQFLSELPELDIRVSYGRGVFRDEWIREAWKKTKPLIDVEEGKRHDSQLVSSLNVLFRLDVANMVISEWSLRPEFQIEVDHWIPVARGGLTEANNCVILHARVNGKKLDKLPQFVDFEEIHQALLRESILGDDANVKKRKPFMIYNVERLLTVLERTSILDLLGYPNLQCTNFPENITEAIQYIDRYYEEKRWKEHTLPPPSSATNWILGCFSCNK